MKKGVIHRKNQAVLESGQGFPDAECKSRQTAVAFRESRAQRHRACEVLGVRVFAVPGIEQEASVPEKRMQETNFRSVFFKRERICEIFHDAVDPRRIPGFQKGQKDSQLSFTVKFCVFKVCLFLESRRFWSRRELPEKSRVTASPSFPQSSRKNVNSNQMQKRIGTLPLHLEPAKQANFPSCRVSWYRVQSPQGCSNVTVPASRRIHRPGN
jgi:hypothetical protein